VKARSTKERRAAAILAAFERVLASPYRRHCIEQGDGDMMVDYFMQAVTLSTNDGYSIPGGWSDDALREVLTAWVTRCPDTYLRDAVTKAESELADCVRYEVGDFSDGLVAHSVGAA